MGPKLGQCAEGERVLEGKAVCCMDAKALGEEEEVMWLEWLRVSC